MWGLINSKTALRTKHIFMQSLLFGQKISGKLLPSNRATLPQKHSSLKYRSFYFEVTEFCIHYIIVTSYWWMPRFPGSSNFNWTLFLFHLNFHQNYNSLILSRSKIHFQFMGLLNFLHFQYHPSLLPRVISKFPVRPQVKDFEEREFEGLNNIYFQDSQLNLCQQQ